MYAQACHSLHQRHRDWQGASVSQGTADERKERERVRDLLIHTESQESAFVVTTRPDSERTIGGSKNGVSVMALANRGSVLVHALLSRASTPVSSRMMANNSWYRCFGQGPRRLGSKPAEAN
jgi:hypothetical protein